MTPHASAADLARDIHARRISPVEVTRAYLDRIDRYDGWLRACVTVRAEAAFAEARAAERAVRGAGACGPLCGVPFGIKDQLWTEGMRTTNGSRLFDGFVPDRDATAVERIRQAGGIVLAKLNMSELALGGTERPLYGSPRNPWDPERSAGESSSGSGVALAADLCAASLGEDTGGSARVPAAYCGVVGLRPTAGRVSRDGVIPLCPEMDAVSPMGHSVEDAALVLGVIAGPDPRDPGTSERSVPDYLASLDGRVAGMRAAVIRELNESDLVDPALRPAFASALDSLRALGVAIVEASVPHVQQAGALFGAIADPVAAERYADALRSRSRVLDRATRTRLQAAALLPATARQLARRLRDVLRSELADALRGADVLLSLTSPLVPPPHAAVSALFTAAAEMRSRFFRRRSYTSCYSLAGLPAISVPCGFTASGLPVGLQIGGAAFGEDAILRVAHAYECSTPWHRRRPALA